MKNKKEENMIYEILVIICIGVLFLSMVVTLNMLKKTNDQLELLSKDITELEQLTDELHNEIDSINVRLREAEDTIDNARCIIVDETPEQLAEEALMDQMAIAAQAIQAEAGDQDLYGMRLVADVIYNRVDSPDFPDSIEEVIFQMNPNVQFAVTVDGAYDKAGWNISQEAFDASYMEYYNRTDSEVLYFATTPCNGKNHFKHGDHWFGY